MEFGRSAVRTARKSGLIAAVLPGIYSVSEPEDETRVRSRALTLWAAPTGTITGVAAAHMWGIVDTPPMRVTVQVPRAWRLRPPAWARLLRVAHVGMRYRMGSIPVVAASDAVVQCWREARRDVGVSTVIESVQRGVTTPSELLDALKRRIQMPRRREFVELLGLLDKTVTSYLEYVAWRDVFPPQLFPHLQWQVEIWTRRRKRVMDAFDAEAMIDLEFDGGSTHGGIDGFERDRERDADIRSVGIEPLHFTYRDLTLRAEWCRREYVKARQSRLRDLEG